MTIEEALKELEKINEEIEDDAYEAAELGGELIYCPKCGHKLYYDDYGSYCLWCREEEAKDIKYSVLDDIERYPDEGHSEETYYYEIGMEMAARDWPFLPNYFLPDHIGEGDKEYEDLKQGYLDNGGKIDNI